MKRLLSVILILGMALTAKAMDYVVVPDGRGDFLSLAAAWDSCSTGDTLSVAAGTYHLATEPLMMNLIPAGTRKGAGKNVTIRAQDGPGTVTIDGDYSDTTMTVFIRCAPWGAGVHKSSIVLDGLILKNMLGGIWSQYGNDLTVKGCSFVSLVGEAVAWEQGGDGQRFLTIEDCVSTRLLSTRLGGGYRIGVSDGSVVNVDSCDIAGALVGIHVIGDKRLPVEAATCLISYCNFDTVGCALKSEHYEPTAWSNFEVRGCVFDHCGSDLETGCSAADIMSSIASFKACIFDSCVAYAGGAIKVARGQEYGSKVGVQLSNCTITSCYSSGCGGALYAGFGSVVEVSGCTIVSTWTVNEAAGGGAFYFDEGSQMRVASSTFQQCVAVGDGGAIYVAGGCLGTISNCELKGNQAVNGGGIYLGSKLELVERLLITGNKATASGGGAYFAAENYGSHWTVARNYAEGNGGGAFLAPRIEAGFNLSIVRTNSTGGLGANVYVDKRSTCKFECTDITQANVVKGVGATALYQACVDLDPLYCYDPNIVSWPSILGTFILRPDSPLKNLYGCGTIGAKPSVGTCP